jgi:hypothetical protein
MLLVQLLGTIQTKTRIMKTETHNEILWFQSLLNELRKGNLDTCERAIKAAIQVLEKKTETNEEI